MSDNRSDRPTEPQADERVLPHLTRYTIESVIGSGGMGTVYKAYDPRLKRHVALKVLESAAPSDRQRFMREAQAQAGLRHECVCPVYEVGNEDGRHYIAMRLIDGWTLSKPRERMPREQIVRIMVQIAEAVHDAHKLGIIHRDIKPSNVMIELADDGMLRPYILDFGLTKETGTSSLTTTGVAMGTPHYMAPEQVLNDTPHLDRRTDVYGLGATLYEAIAGRPPFLGANSINLFWKVLNQDAPPIRKTDRTVPQDLDRVILKCLEKEQRHRYDSAHALAEDLKRFLDGEPVLARRPSRLYRLSKRMRKNRLLTATVAGAALVILGLLAFGVRMELQSRRRQAFAQELGKAHEQIESIMRSGVLMPTHDITREKGMIRDVVREVERRIGEVGSAGEAVGELALGRTHSILQEDEEAAEHLEAAWEGEYREPEVAYEIGVVLGRLYEREIERVVMTGGEGARDELIGEIDRKYREPALAMLRGIGDSKTVNAERARALRAILERRHSEALRAIDLSGIENPWTYEESALRGYAHRAHGVALALKGDRAGALSSFEESEKAYRQAVATARSHVWAHADLGNVLAYKARLLAQTGSEARSAYEAAVESEARAAEIDPEGAAYRLRLAEIFIEWAEYERAGADPDARAVLLRTAEWAALDAGRLAPEDAAAVQLLVRIRRAID